MDSNSHLVKNNANLKPLKTPNIWQFLLFSNTPLKNAHLISSLTELQTLHLALPLSATVEELSYQISVRCGIMRLRDSVSPYLSFVLTLNRLNSKSFSTIRHVFNYSSHSRDICGSPLTLLQLYAVFQ